MSEHMTYRDAGVDIDAGNQAVERIREHVAGTRRPECLGELGGFGGAFALDTSRYRQPVLVSGTDGVGTKLRIAFEMGRHDSIGIDVVAMCVNDILVQGAEPLFFLDYLAVGRLDPAQVEQIVAGVARGCRQAGCALIGGETAEMPGFYPPGEYDVAGFCVGVVERDRMLAPDRVRDGDVLLGLASSGLHSNGFSLVRRIVRERALDQPVAGLAGPLGEVLLTPTRIYVKSILSLLEEVPVSGLAHITGGGLTENVPRMLPAGMDALIRPDSWPVPAVFRFLQEEGRVLPDEMLRTFNMGIGMVLAVRPEDEGRARDHLTGQGEQVVTIGRVIQSGQSEPRVVYA